MDIGVDTKRRCDAIVAHAADNPDHGRIDGDFDPLEGVMRAYAIEPIQQAV